jgi:hypothetical protein
MSKSWMLASHVKKRDLKSSEMIRDHLGDIGVMDDGWRLTNPYSL